jgi:putative membrane protein
MSQDRLPVKQGAIAGAIGGCVGALAMELLQIGGSHLFASVKRWANKESDMTHHPQTDERRGQQPSGEEGMTSTAKAANAIVEPVTGKRLPPPAERVASETLHYVTGIIPGALYGALNRNLRKTTFGRGVLLGTVVWVAVNEFLIPRLGLSKRASKYPLRDHVLSFGTHVAYGLTTELVRRLSLRLGLAR